MDRELVRRWVQALRSGKYKQGKSVLRSIRPDGADEYCCLGVLCDIAGVQWEYDPESTAYSANGEDTYLYLPLDVSERIGMSKSTQFALTRMNDHGRPFSVIASAIESWLGEPVEQNEF